MQTDTRLSQSQSLFSGRTRRNAVRLSLILLVAAAGFLLSYPLTEARRGDGFRTTIGAPAVAKVVEVAVATITVNDLGDAISNNGKCTLREAIIAANTNTASGGAAGECVAGTAGIDNIVFNLGAGTPTINITSALPTITEPVTISGNTGGATRVELNGSGAGANVNGLTISAGNSVIERLVINRFTGDGIRITGTGFNTVKGCILGLDSSGTIARANNVGLAIRASSNNTIGGTLLSDRNVISGNTTDGVLIMRQTTPSVVAASGNKIINSYIGPDVTGRFDLGNTGFGVNVSGGDASVIGGATNDQRNIISGNNGGGVHVGTTPATNNKIIGNYIGIDATGVFPLGNGVAGGGGTAPGVWIEDAPNNFVGGTVESNANGTLEGEFNFIKYNLQNGGVVVTGSSATGNSILHNYIYGNAGLGIDLGNNGVTGNDPFDPDSGPNNLQNAPVLSGVSSSSNSTTISGALDSVPFTSFRIEFFFSSQCDASGSGEGETYIGAVNMTTGLGSTGFSGTFNNFVAPAGTFLTATATRLSGPADTSEFSGCLLVPGGGPTTCDAVFNPPSANFRMTGGTASISVILAGGCGWTASSTLPWVMIQSGASGTGSGTVVINVAANSGAQRLGQITIAGKNYNISQEGPCTASLNPPVKNFTAAGGNAQVELITGSGCAWTVTKSPSDTWITINSATSGTGPTFVDFSVAPNTGTALRVGLIVIAGQNFAIIQDQPCGATIDPTSKMVSASSGNYSFALTIPAGCSWMATKTDSWITLTGATSGTGNGTVNYSVSANTGQQRSGVIMVAGKSHTVIQDGGCQPTFNPTTQMIGQSAGSHSFDVNIGSGCNWTPTTTDSWITITSGSKTGNGTVDYSVTANSGAQRIGRITVAGLDMAVVQDGACVYSLSETTKQFPVQGGTASVSVSVAGGCPWTAMSQTPWIVITSGASGSGNGTVNYLVATNGSGSQRSGIMKVAGTNFIVQQEGGCTYTVSPTTQNVPAAGGGFTTSVTTAGGCAWTASSNDSWITITSSLLPDRNGQLLDGRAPSAKNTIAGTGNGTVGYSVAANTGPPRTGTIFAAGEIVTVNQANGCPISVSPANLSAGQIGANYSQQLMQSGGSGAITWSVSSGSLPPGLTLNPGTGVLSGIPSVPATFGFTVRATDSTSCYGEMSYMVVINCQPLNITPTTISNGVAGTPYNQPLTLNGDSGVINWTISAGALPNGLFLNPSTGLLAGAPLVTGMFNFTVQATVNATGCFATRAYSMMIGCQTISVDQTSLNAATLGTPYTQTMTQTGGIGSITWSISGGSLPANLTLSPAGVISGTPNATGSFPVTLRATDANNCFGEKSFTLSVNCPSFTITPATLPQGTRGSGYSQQLSQTGATGSVTWTLFNSSLPANLMLSSSGLISGTPNTAGSFPITVRATDSSSGCFTDKTYMLVINCPTITVTPAMLPGGTVGTGYSQGLSQTGGVGSITWSVSTGSLPNGIGLNPASGLLSGTPTVSGTFTFTARATDGNNCFGETAYQVAIGCQTLSISPGTLSSIPIATQYNQQLTLNGAGGAIDWTISAGALPSGVTLNQTTGLLSGIPNTAGSFNFTVKATVQSSGCMVQQAYTLTVACPTINISPTTLNQANLGVPYNLQLTQTGGVGSIIWSVQTGTLPSNINLSANGLLAGTPVMSGNYPVTIRATDSNGCFGERNYTLVVGSCPTITVSPGTLPSGLINTNYSQQLSASGGAGNYSFTFSGNLPTGVTLSSGGLLSGTPGSVGAFNFIVTATDQSGCMAAKAYTLTICSLITVNPATLPSGVVGTNYSQNLTAVGGNAPYSFTFSGTLPAGLTLSNEGLLSGLPTQTGTFNFTVTATDTSSCTGSRSYSVVISPAGLQFYPLAHPVRMLDTRAGQSACDMPGAQIPGGTSRLQTAAGRTCDGITIPASARALTGNVTTVQSGGGFLTLYPSDAMQPTVANSNYQPNQILNNVFTVGLGADGAFKIFVTTNTDVVIDITGYYAPPGAGGLYFHPLPSPIRMLDTRAGQMACDMPGAPITGGVERIQQGRVFCSGITIPSSASALVGNATTVGPAAQGFLTLYPGNAATRPLAASSNYASGQTMNGPFAVGLAPDGTFKIYSSQTTDLVIDVLGYYSPDAVDLNGTGLLFNPLPRPVRMLETRAGFTGCYMLGVPLGAGSTRIQQARGVCDGMTVAATAKAIVGNATAVLPASNGFLTFWPSDAAQPGTANSNYQAGKVFNRHITVGLGADGAFKIFTSAMTDLVIDVSGYFAP
ncbi:MAG: putative Ig domain-containing protein [Acidobacteria bacterium]|nr:putative Ig domain-containing protein [Acidobacteriota bacterium]